jgi:membrane protein
VQTVLRAIVYEVRAEQVTFLAGSIAYHAFVSLLPLLLLLVLLLSALGDLAPTDAVFTLVRVALTDSAADVLVPELRRTSQSRELSLIGGAVLVWGTLRVFRGLDTAFSDVYETEAENTILDQLFDGTIVFVAFAVAVVIAGTLHSVVPSGADGGVFFLLNRVALVVGLTLTLFPMYFVFPDTDVSVVEVLPGTVFAAVGLTAFESLFRLYIQWSGEQPEESVLAAILVFLTWLYFSGFVILVGAAINAVLSNRSADVSIEPVIGNVHETPERPERARLASDLETVEHLFDDPRSFSITVDGQTVALPAPQYVTTDPGDSLLGSGMSAEFRWSPVEEGGVMEDSEESSVREDGENEAPLEQPDPDGARQE